ncbi:MAG: FlgD immunoglobulin-like domain containing protein [Candidatus Poribacteria bacterium]|nr:FlgD immunoglobulin-like domain containing protein [Candidatus Poribacteria bacterium]MDP6750986.1 FlgD immunoglobulin-like domain containing protein [Candidatus Poribacteria bacterium]MDP6998869.1 FlgD immunoglobulin-like domain containing protein [Candidatus Poribacteria bacterium]
MTDSSDYMAKVWQVKTGQELFTLKGHNGWIWPVAYSPGGQRIVRAGSDGIAQIYTINMDELLQLATSRVTRQLTAEEKERYVPFTLDQPASVTIKVYNVAGQLVEWIAQQQTFGSGKQAIRWNGRDSEGEIVASGLYIVTVTVGDQTQDKVVNVWNH